MGTYQTLDLIDTFASYSSSIPRAACLVVDPDAARAGHPRAVRAVKLSEAYLAAHRRAGGAAALGAAALKEAGVGWRDVFEEVPLSVRNSPLAVALARSVLGGAGADEGDADRLALGAPRDAGRAVEHAADCLDDLGAEAQRLSYYHRALARSQQAAAAFAAKRRAEYAARRAAGEPPLPEEDAAAGKPPPEPSPVDGYCVTAQIDTCCDRLGAGAVGALEKLALFDALERAAR